MDPSGHEVCPGLLKRIVDAIDNRTATKDEYKRLSGYLKDKLNNGQILTPAEMDAAGKLGIGRKGGSGAGSRLIPGQQGIVTGGNSTKLGKNMMESMGQKRSTKWTGYEAQHIIPIEAMGHPVIKKIGMDFDDPSNGMFLRQRDEGISTTTRHQGYHVIYNDIIMERLDSMDISLSVNELEAKVYNLQQASKDMLKSGIPIYAKDNESGNSKLRNASNKKYGVGNNERTKNLIDRWLKRYGG